MSDDPYSSTPQDSAAVPGSGPAGAVLGPTYEELLVDLQAPEAETRWKAAVSLGSLGDQRALDPLIAALHDPHWYVSWNAAEALGKLNNKQAIDPLLALLKQPEPLTSNTRNTRIAAIKALGKLKDPRAVDSLLNLLDPADPDTYKAAVKSLEELGAADKIPVLVSFEERSFWARRWMDDTAIGILLLGGILLCICMALPWVTIGATCRNTCSDTGTNIVRPGPQEPSAFNLAGSGVTMSMGETSWTDDSGNVGVTFTLSPSQTYQYPLLWLVLVAGIALIALSAWLFVVRALPRKRRLFHRLILIPSGIAAVVIVASVFMTSSALFALKLNSTVIYTSGTPGDSQAAISTTPDVGFWMALCVALVIFFLALMRARLQRWR